MLTAISFQHFTELFVSLKTLVFFKQCPPQAIAIEFLFLQRVYQFFINLHTKHDINPMIPFTQFLLYIQITVSDFFLFILFLLYAILLNGPFLFFSYSHICFDNMVLSLCFLYFNGSTAGNIATVLKNCYSRKRKVT